jgi:hypothetical protein
VSPRSSGSARRRYYVYVVELDDAVGPRRNPGYPSVYVGQSVVPPDERLRQHKDGYRSSRYVRKHGKHLRPGLYRRFNPMATRDQAVAMEQETRPAPAESWLHGVRRPLKRSLAQGLAENPCW